MDIFNLYGDEWSDEAVERPGGTFKDAWIGARLGSELRHLSAIWATCSARHVNVFSHPS